MAKKLSINPTAEPVPVAQQPQWQDYLEGIREGNRMWLAKAITLIESSLQVHQEAAIALLSHLPDAVITSVRIAITGAPGAGKSTLIEHLGIADCAAGLPVAVLAIDPSSSRSGGSLLGDKTRMEKLTLQKQAFIRPSPSRGHLGGVTAYTRETISICEAAGFQRIYIETVGVGQSEYEAASLTDLFVLVLHPGAGDQLQGIKKGIVEMADLIVVNKCDGALKEAALRTQSEYRQALQIMPQGEQPEVLCISAQEGTGLDKLTALINEIIQQKKQKSAFSQRRKEQNQDWFRRSLERQLLQWMLADLRLKQIWLEMETAVRDGSIAPVVAAARCLESIRTVKSGL